ncbi:TonB-dependent receptor [Niveispirillum sp. KHB5.9]|uniref:TonB-dependent receptor n=1 Tax=Niveispirillum sp. KHB5.9 TaxID=3400269 RepID=UPI003A846EE8
MGMLRNTLLLATGMMAVTAPVLAQGQPTASSGILLEEIIVTAQKRRQTLIDVPQSVSVVTGATLEKQQANTIQDYLQLVPGLQLAQDTPGQGRLVMRGVNTGGVASTVSVYMDETPFGSSTALANGAILAGDFDTFDIARVEVLRGPQGTLYGASSLGGVLKYITNEPDTDGVESRSRVGVETTKGGDLSYSGNTLVNMPMGQDFAVRASGYYRKTGGFIDSIGTAGSDRENNINDSQSYGGRVSALYAPDNGFSLRLTALLQDIKADAPSTVESDHETIAMLYGRPTFSQFIPSFRDIKYRVYNGTAKYEAGFADILSSTSFSSQKQASRTDLTHNLSGLINGVFGTPNEIYLGQDTNVEKFTQELRLTSSEAGPFEWLVGGYYVHEKALIRQGYFAVQPGTLNPVTSLPLLADVQLPSKYEEFAGFANATVHLNEQVDVDFGARYSHNRQSASQTTDGVLAGGASAYPDIRSSENVFTFSAAPKYKISENASLYVRVAKGYRPGGPNPLPPTAPADALRQFDSDTLISYEAGAKMQSPDGMVSAELSVFHLDWRDIQLIAVVDEYGININGGKAKSNGAEGTVTFRPMRGLELSANAAYTDAKLRDDTTPVIGGLDGDRLPFTPKFTAALNGDYSWDLTGDITASVGGSVRFLSKQYGSYDAAYRTANGHQRQLPSYEVIDLRAGLDFGSFALDAYAKNIGNSKGRTSTGSRMANGGPVNPGGALATGIIRPQSFGLTLSTSY